MFKKKATCFMLIFLIFLTPVFAEDDEDENGGYSWDEVLYIIGAALAVGVVILLRYLNLLPDPLYNFLLCISFFGLFVSLQLLFDSVGFTLSIGGIEIPPLAIGFLLLFLIYHQAILQILGLFKQSL